jgi:hypothetical protein
MYFANTWVLMMFHLETHLANSNTQSPNRRQLA